MVENDDDWSPVHRETVEHLENRVKAFMQFLTQRSESMIAVVSHGVWIEICLRLFCPEALDHGRKRVHNCNIFVADCVSVSGIFLRLQNVHQIH